MSIKPKIKFNIVNKCNNTIKPTLIEDKKEIILPLNDKKYRLADFYAGVGGFSFAFSNLGVTTVFAIDNSKECKITFDHNHNVQHGCNCRDIETIKSSDVPDIDILTAGFNCQPFSIAGERKGFEDTRTNSLWVMFDIIKDKQPKCVFFENVKGLLTHNNGNSFNTIITRLKECGYNSVFHEVLNTCTHTTIPQNRERLFIVAFRDDLKINTFDFPSEITQTEPISNFLQSEIEISAKYYYTPKSKIYNTLKDNITDDAVYQYRRGIVRRNQSGLVPTLVATMGTGGHNVPIIKTYIGIRKLTPLECFRLQGYGDPFLMPKGKSFTLPKLADSHLYKQAGNGITVTLVRRIAKEIIKVLN